MKILTQRRKGAKKTAKQEIFLCAFAPLRETGFWLRMVATIRRNKAAKGVVSVSYGHQ